MKKRFVLIFAAIFLPVLCFGCQNAAGEKSLYEHGLEVISLAEEMAESDAYISLYSISREGMELLSAVREGDYTEPTAVYRIVISEEDFLKMPSVADTLVMNDLSDRLKQYVNSNMHHAASSLVTYGGNLDVVTATAVCTASKTFVLDDITENTVYLYVYENAVPAIVTYTVGEGGAVSASAKFVFDDTFRTDTVNAIERFFAEMDVDVSIIPI